MGVFGHRLVIGPGGSGTSHRLATWTEDARASTEAITIVEVRGDPAVPIAPGVRDHVRDAIDEQRGEQRSVIVAHDLHWLDDEVVIDLIHASESATVDVWASRRPWPVTDVLRSLDDRLTATNPAERTGPCLPEALAPVVAERTGRAASSVFVEDLHRASAGLVGPACDALDTRWQPEQPITPELCDRLLRRLGRAGPSAAALVRILVVDPTVDTALADRLALEMVSSAAPGPAGTALRAATAGGVLDADGHVIPLLADAVRDDLTGAERGEVHERLAAAFAGVDQARAVDHAVAGSSRGGDVADELLAAARSSLVGDPARAAELLERAISAGADPMQTALIEAELHLRAGRIDALAALARIDGPISEEVAAAAARLRLVAELRAGRWDGAASGTTADTASADLRPMRQLARTLLGQVGDGAATSEHPTRMVTALIETLDGHRVEAVRAAVELADDEAAGDDEHLGGIGAAFVAGLIALVVGELPTAESTLARSIEAGRPAGEIEPMRSLQRYVSLRRGRASTPASTPASTAASTWARDLLVHAAVESALARRTGDVTRLRAAWTIADPVLVRVHPSWLFLEPLTELLATGTHLERRDRVTPIIEALEAQVHHAAAPDGAVATSFAWLGLQLALATGDGIDAAAQRLRCADTASAHQRARSRAAQVWARIAAGTTTESEVLAAVDALMDVDEGWEAARLAGQAALGAQDPAVTRRLLERARAAAPDSWTGEDGADHDGLVALGLSEREAEVARLVADGRTHKEVGAELYISAKTVEHHVARIRQKLGAGSRAELLAIVREHGGSRS